MFGASTIMPAKYIWHESWSSDATKDEPGTRSSRLLELLLPLDACGCSVLHHVGSSKP